MARGDRSLHPHRPVRGGQVHGYAGVATDAAADPARVLPPEVVTTPPGAVTPLKTSSTLATVPVDGGASALPDPAGAPDGQVPTTVDEEYVLANPIVGEVQVVVRTLTSAEFLALGASDTPIALVAGEAGKIFWPLSGIAVFRFGTVEYSNVGALIVGNDPLFLDAEVLVGAVLTGSEDLAVIIGPVSPASMPQTLVPGEAMLIWSSDDPSDGDGAVDVTVFYREVDVS